MNDSEKIEYLETSIRDLRWRMNAVCNFLSERFDSHELEPVEELRKNSNETIKKHSILLELRIMIAIHLAYGEKLEKECSLYGFSTPVDYLDGFRQGLKWCVDRIHKLENKND